MWGCIRVEAALVYSRFNGEYVYDFIDGVLTLATTVLVIIAIVNGSLDVPGICMPNLGLGMFGFIGIINLL